MLGKESGHGVVLIGYNNCSLKFLNSWGTDFADNGFFSIENEFVLNQLRFYDIYI